MAEGEGCSTSVEDLPEECLLIIANQLGNRGDRDSFSSTCRRWLQVESCLRHTLNLPHHFCDEESYDHLLECLLNRFQAVNIISLTGCVKLSDFALSILKFKCPQLKKLYLDRCYNITDDGLRSVGFASLELLSLYRCNVSDIGLDYISRACPNLQVLNLSYCLNITDVGVSALGQGCLNLKEMIISNSYEIRGGGFSKCSSLVRLDASCCKLSDKGLSLAVGGCDKLEYLDISHTRSGSEQLGPPGFATIGTLCKHLQVLNLKLCRALDDVAVTEIAKGCQALKEWNLAVCSDVKEAGWRAISQYCKNLEILHVNRCRSLTDASILHIRNGCPRLKRLYLNGCPLVSRVAIELFKRYRCQVEIVTLEFMVHV
ncbi:F-box and leucine-rich repeat protein 2/20 [Marchantia polymorpha subsp. ruderalis]|uniref:F-box/LRR-repeat protein 15-like leucin rich repeat domain-containing protein n=2 Tax=Marchantia polymorpha TaxID=3197 RepID=A0AAF6BL08_MARPO|nr:hypothetical protein MARPO_0166s0007 [Marchantia polymorpha]BBN12692.1 hypothetical protein Mp_5g22130 [Marchantia polymorpha subsp. ruderalis]|eukprot:PTQ28348.1 hypothetical protein MARPO_0166s0007 [Marchantia polymorpha]